MNQNQNMPLQENPCPVQCPTCNQTDASRTARFKRLAWTATRIRRQVVGKANAILFLLDGRIELRPGPNKERFEMRPGKFVFLPRGLPYELEVVENAHAILLEFSNRVILGGQDFLAMIASKSHVRGEGKPSVLEMNEPMWRLLGDMQIIESPCWHIAKQYDLFINLASHYDTRELSGFFSPIIRPCDDFRAFVLNNYLYGDSLNDVAGKANMSTGYFLKRFKKEFGMTTYQWLVKQKEIKLLQLLSSGWENTKDIAEKLGFKSPACLYLFCRRHLDLRSQN